MRTAVKIWATLAVAALLCACGRPFDIKTAPGFVELQNQEPNYAYRATTPEGVVVAVQVEDLEGDAPGDLAFWTRACTLQLRDVDGYALLETRDVKSADGVPGKQLRFGSDQGNKPFAYWLTLYIVDKRLFLVESGGAKPAVERYAQSLEWMNQSVRVR